METEKQSVSVLSIRIYILDTSTVADTAMPTLRHCGLNHKRIGRQNQDHRLNRWFALPLKGAITGLTPVRGFEGLAPHYISSSRSRAAVFMLTYSCYP